MKYVVVSFLVALAALLVLIRFEPPPPPTPHVDVKYPLILSFPEKTLRPSLQYPKALQERSLSSLREIPHLGTPTNDQSPPLKEDFSNAYDWGTFSPTSAGSEDARAILRPYSFPIPSSGQQQQPAPPTANLPQQATSPDSVYIPPGARGEAEAQLTLIAPQLSAWSEPSLTSIPAPFMLHEGETIRPLMRLRSADTFDWILFERDGQRWWTQAEFFIRLGPVEVLPTSSLANYEIGLEPVDRDTALPPNYMPSDLVPVPQEFVLGFKTILLRREAANALVDMLQEARRHDLEIRVFSGFRDFATQKRLYLEAIAHDGPKQNGTAAPGYSEHQLGTTVDVSNRDPKMVLSSRFGETAEGQWLFQHAHEFGFIHSYTTENTEEVGYKPEPWHLRYVGQKQAQQILASRKELNGTAP